MARSFNGTTDIINCGTGGGVGAAGPWSISVFYYPTTPSSAGCFVAKRDSPTNNQFSVFIAPTQGVGNLDCITVTVGSIYLQNATNSNMNAWNHLCVCGSAAGLDVYRNGVLDTSVGSGGGQAGYGADWKSGIGTGWVLSIGGLVTENTNFFVGRLGDTGVWNVKLNASEAAALAAGVRPYRIRRSNLVTYWPLEGTASPEPDVIGGNNGTLTGTSQVANPFNYTTPKYGSRVFNGSSDTIALPEPPFDFERTQALTFSAWVYPNVTRSGGGANYTIYSKLDSSSPNSGISWSLDWGDSGFTTSLGFNVFLMNTFGSNGVAINTTTTDLLNNTWWHLAFTYNGNSTAAGIVPYVNALVQSNAIGFNSLSSSILNNITPYIGSRNNTNTFMNGRIADLAIWNVALSASEIAKLAAGFRPHQVRLSGLIDYWPLEGTASPEPDMIAGNNGTLTGTSAGASPTRYQDVVGA